MLGFRWFHAGDMWTHIPKLDNIDIEIDSLLTPSFEYRNIFGQTGLPRNPYLDDKKIVAKEWVTWERRNRLGSFYTLPGHSAFEFIKRNRITFKEHPEYLSLVDNQRGGKAGNGKFCISNADFRNFFITDMCNQLVALQKQNPKAPRYVFSVEPSDGGGHCTCESCKNLGKVSNRVFFLANETAKAFQKITDKAFVCLYAYNQHASAPSFEIEKNVIVQIVPYKFQQVSSPDTLINRWKTISPKLFIRDYYALPINNLDRPLQKGSDEIALARKVKQWHSIGVLGVTMESSFGIPTSGIGLYMLARLMWNGNEETSTLIGEYYHLNYGENDKDIREILATLKNHKGINDSLVYVVAQNLNQQTTEIKDTSVHNRIVVSLAYLQYLNLLSKYNQAKKEEQLNAVKELLVFAHQTFRYNVVHTAPLLNYLARNKNIQTYIVENWEPKTPKGMNTEKMALNYSQIKLMSINEIEKNVSKALSKQKK
jgi:hypothetical protein